MSAPAAPRFALGTAQFGLPYGVASTGRPLARETVAEVLRVAWAEGVDLLDTAAAYGEAERVIGELRPPQAPFRIVSKIGAPAEPGVPSPAEAVQASLRRLRVKALDALLVHHAAHLLAPGGEQLFTGLQRLRGEGLLGRIGVSVYDSATLQAVLERFPVEIVQLPLNLLDQRFAQDGSLAELARRGIEVHTRSAFLQGVLLTDASKLPPRFAGARGRIDAFHTACRAAGISRSAGALGFVAGCPGVSRIVIGVDSAAQLRENLAAFSAAAAARWQPRPGDYAVADPRVIDPRTWTA